MTLVTVATCNLNQWALDFDGNLERTRRSIVRAKEQGARYRVGPELELSGYGAEDHFLEQDTFMHCEESLAQLLSGSATDDILCDIGMPVLHHGVCYNCRVFCLNRRVLLIRPKLFMADDGNYRETRWFTRWTRLDAVEDHVLPQCLRDVTGQTRVPFGAAVLDLLDTTVASETCEELFTPQSPHIAASLSGAEIVGNGSGSHHQLRKLNTRLDLILSATAKCGGVYCYANQRGCDGGRLYYDGCSMIASNGAVVGQAAQFSLSAIEVVSATVDLRDVRAFRASVSSRSKQAAEAPRVPRVSVDFALTATGRGARAPSPPLEVRYHSPEEEIMLGPACWLWDYLRRSGAQGYFLPLSGGADSASVATIVGVMCQLAAEAVHRGDGDVLRDLRRVAGRGRDWTPESATEIAGLVLHTTYMGTVNSSQATRTRAQVLAHQIGAYHKDVDIDSMVAAVLAVFAAVFSVTPRFLSDGGTMGEDLALQNIQARLRMVLAYLFAQLLPWTRNRQGFLLVLGSANVDEALRGYMTKYDCSSADLNPIGAISKLDLKRMMHYAAVHRGYPVLEEIVGAPPTAELRPMASGEDGEAAGEHSQTDEEDMGMTYEELGFFGRLRNIDRCGPLSMFDKLCVQWPHVRPAEVAVKVKRFFRFYAINRHKLTTLTPSYHAEQYSPDDNRFDHRQFLYNTRWPRQFKAIDDRVAAIGGSSSASSPGRSRSRGGSSPTRSASRGRSASASRPSASGSAAPTVDTAVAPPEAPAGASDVPSYMSPTRSSRGAKPVRSVVPGAGKKKKRKAKK